MSRRLRCGGSFDVGLIAGVLRGVSGIVDSEGLGGGSGFSVIIRMRPRALVLSSYSWSYEGNEMSLSSEVHWSSSERLLDGVDK